MARELKWWIATLAGCAAVGIVYLPPRPTPLLMRRFHAPPPATPYRLRVQALADAWRDATMELRLLAYRDQLRPELERRRALEVPGPAVIVEWPDAPPWLRGYVVAALDTAWSRLELGVSKISVGIVYTAGIPKTAASEPSQAQGSTSYLLPDSTDRTTCLVFLQGFYWARRLQEQPNPVRDARFEAFLQNALGPCAFYAAFGAPGRDLRRWLGARRFDLALYPQWAQAPGGESGYLLPDRSQPWFWGQVYSQNPNAIACLAGRPEGCRSAVLTGAGTPDPPSPIVTTDRWWWHQALVGGDRYLSDAVRTIGRERFRRFWSSELAVDTALALAFRKPVGEWTREWQASLVPPFRLGPAVAPASILLGLLLAAVAVVSVVRTVSRREVR
jgi:hypothetical protein